MEQAKVTFAQKNHQPEFANAHDHLKASLIAELIPKKNNEILIDDNGRKKFDAKYSDSETFKPSCKLVEHRDHGSDYQKRGKMFIPCQPNCVKEIENQKRRYIESEATRRSDTSQLPCVEWTTKKVVMMEDGNPAYNKVSKEFDMESFMNQKQRIKSELQRRNNISTASPGDKPYSEADRSSGFYASGGLVTGSTIALRKSAKPTPMKSSDCTNKSLGIKLGLTYAEKKKLMESQHEIGEVNDLTVCIYIYLYI